jgi:hypothetical protein
MKKLAPITPLVMGVLTLSLVGCNRVQSDAREVNRSGTWRVTFERLKDVSGPPYEVREPAPEYPPRVMRAPVPDAASCSSGCECRWVTANDDCSGDVSQLCRAVGGFVETCAASHTILNCQPIWFDSERHTSGVCLLEDSSRSTPEFGYDTIRRYGVTLDRASYD